MHKQILEARGNRLRSRPQVATLVATFALCAGSAVVARSAIAEEGPPHFGFWLEARAATGTVVAGLATVPVVQPSLVVGGRIAGRANLGLGFSFMRLSSGMVTTSTFAFQPTVVVDLVKSADERVAFTLRGALPLGASVASNTRNLFAIGYDAALGVRYSPHPMFAIGLEGGILGTFIDPGSTSVGFGVQTVYGAISGTFFYGRSAH
jgi:hypothetical protein